MSTVSSFKAPKAALGVVVVVVALAIPVLAAPTSAGAATSTQSYSRSITQGTVSGTVRWTSSPDKYYVTFTVKDTRSDGLCVTLQKSDSGYAYWNWSRIATACGAGKIYGPFGTYYDHWYNVGAIKLRLCSVYNGRITSCGAALLRDNPYL